MSKFKIQIPNSKLIPNPKRQILIRAWEFGFNLTFGFWNWDFLTTSQKL